MAPTMMPTTTPTTMTNNGFHPISVPKPNIRLSISSIIAAYGREYLNPAADPTGYLTSAKVR
ncbi:MAG: hypothetical protein OXH94_15095 [Rhodospirillales bacterium]|nr:hypothetical protein [Rhodospirillales bacterium]